MMVMQLDQWQKDVLETKGHICLRSGRQVGKSTIISILVGEYAQKHPNRTILVISAVERQAYLLFEKILAHLVENHKDKIATGVKRPTKTILQLKNGTVIYCLPTGLSGYGIRGYTIDLLVADEAAFIGEEVWQAVTPMLATTKGRIILLSTPFGSGTYFYRCFDDPKFTKFHISSEDCPRMDKEFLAREKETMTKMQYAQEYLGEFVDELRQFFSNALIKECCVLKRREAILKNRRYYLGIDVAAMGKDQSTFEILERSETGGLFHVENITTTKTRLTETTNTILQLEDQYIFRKIYIDDGGLGVGVFHQLLEENATKRKIIPINNAKRVLDREGLRTKRLMKEDLYNNLRRLMERREIQLLKDDDVIMSLKSIQYEYSNDERGQRRLRIFGNYSHIVEGLIRAAWGVKDKGLNLWVESS
jgi:hypothetical protein